MEILKIEFIASLPPIQSAIQLDGMGDGGRIKLDISRQFATELLKLQKMAGKQIKITAEMIENDCNKPDMPDFSNMVSIGEE